MSSRSIQRKVKESELHVKNVNDILDIHALKLGYLCVHYK